MNLFSNSDLRASRRFLNLLNKAPGKRNHLSGPFLDSLSPRTKGVVRKLLSGPTSDSTKKKARFLGSSALNQAATTLSSYALNDLGVYPLAHSSHQSGGRGKSDYHRKSLLNESVDFPDEFRTEAVVPIKEALTYEPRRNADNNNDERSFYSAPFDAASFPTRTSALDTYSSLPSVSSPSTLNQTSQREKRLNKTKRKKSEQKRKKKNTIRKSVKGLGGKTKKNIGRQARKKKERKIIGKKKKQKGSGPRKKQSINKNNNKVKKRRGGKRSRKERKNIKRKTPTIFD